MQDPWSAPDDNLLPTQDASGGHASRRPSLWSLLRGRMHWALLLALLFGSAGGVGGYLYVRPYFRSTGQVRISPDVRPVMEHTDTTRQIPHYDSYLDAQVSLMRSRQVIERAVQHEAWQRLGRDDSESFLRYFRSQLEVSRSRGGQVVELRFYDPEPEAAVAGVAAAIDAYRSIYQQQQSNVDAQIHNQLHERRARLSRELAQLRQRRDEIAGRYGVEGLVRRYQLQLEQFTEVQQMLRRTRVQIEAMREHEARHDGPLPSVVPLDQIAEQDDRMRRMLEEREELQSYIDRGNRLGLGERHREMNRARVQLDALNQRIEQYAARFAAADLGMPNLRSGFDAMPDGADGLLTLPELEARERDLQRLHDQVRSETTALGERQQQIDDIHEQIEQLRHNLAQTEQRIDQLNLQSPLVSRIEVINWGDETPIVPVNQGQRLQATVIGAGAGIMLGLGLVMLVGRFDRRVHHIEDAQGSQPTARLLGILPTLPDNLAAPEQVAIAAHCVHHIRTLLQLGSKHGPAQVLVVTSPSSGSGKTSLTAALGLSFATSETRTLLIDCDVVGAGLSRRLNAVVRRPLSQVLRREGMVDAEVLEEARHISEGTGQPLGEVLVEMGRLSREDLERARALRRESSLGLPDVCEGEPLEACIAEAGIPRLSVLPVGRALPHQAGALSPSAIKRVFDQARSRFDVVLVDTGPMPGSIEASMAASEADRVVLVVSRGDEKSLVMRSLNQLREIDTKLAGIVFNHAPAEDVERSSYASTVSGTVDGKPPMPPMRVDQTVSARFGPVGSAVASCSGSDKGGSTVAAHSNGHASSDEGER